MAFISSNILLDLPLHEMKDDTGQQWEDKGINGYNATANENCKLGTLEKLGSCLHIMDGGVLTFPDEAADLIAGKEKCFTVEFWADPDLDPDPNSTARRQILSGPVNVWKEQNKICWSVVGDPSETCYTVEGAAGLHHWAIVANTAVDPPRHVFRDGDEVQIETHSASSAVATGLVIGAEENGWTGKLAHLRMWSAALDAVQLKKNMDRDITAHAAFKASTGIEWRLLNANDEPSLYIQGSRQQELRLVVENRAGKTLIIPRRTDTELSRENWHFNLVFRPGTLAKRKLDDDLLELITQANPGWRVVNDKWEQQDRLHFLWTGPSDKTIAETEDQNILAKTIDKTLAPGESLTIVLPDVAAEPGSGSRTTRVLLKYDGLKLGEDSTAPLDGHRSQLLNILYRDPLVPYCRPPLEVGVVGAPAILNNGTETCLTLYIKNLNRDEDGNATPIVLGPPNAPTDKKAKFILEIDSLTEAVETPGSKLKMGDKYALNGKAYEVLELTEPSKLRVKFLADGTEKTIPMPNATTLVWVFRKGPGPTDGTEKTIPVDAKGLGDVDDLLGATPTIADPNAPIDINGGTAIGSVVRWEMPVKGTVASIVARLADLVGLYQRLPVENEWHEGRIQLDGENMKWTNNAGVSWRLIPDLQNNVLKTDASNPYDENGPRHFTLDQKLDEQDGFLRDGFRFGGEFYQRDVPVDANLGLEKNETVLLTLAGLKTTAPPGRSVLRLRYEDLDDYGEGVFEIPIDKVPAVPAKLKQGGAGYGLAIGHDPRVGQTDPNAEVLNEVLSVKQVGNGDAVRIENTDAVRPLKLTGHQSQRWDVKEDGTIRHRAHPNYCLNLHGDIARNDGVINLWKFNGHQSQRWDVREDGTIRHRAHPNYCLNLDFDNAQNNGVINLWEFTDHQSQSWDVREDGTIRNKAYPNYFLNLHDDDARNGGVIDIQHIGGSGLTVVQNGSGPSAKFSGGSGVEIGSGLTVVQNGSGPSAKFSGGSGVEITGKLVAKNDAEITGSLRVEERIRDKTGEVMPVGTVVAFAGATAPDGWLMCRGQRVTKPVYTELAKVLGYSGVPFNVPNYQQRFLVGAVGKGEYRPGATGGQAAVTLTEAQIPRHNHKVNDPKHSHYYLYTEGKGGHLADTDNEVFLINYLKTSTKPTVSKGTGITLNSAGGRASHENRPPFVALNYIIKY